MRFGTEIGLPTERNSWHKTSYVIVVAAIVIRFRIRTLTNSGDWNPVGQECHMFTNKQTRGKTHNLFEQVLQPPTKTAIWENHLLEELILPEWVNGHQISPVGDRQCVQESVLATCEYSDVHWLLWFPVCLKGCSHPNSRAILTNPFLCFTTTVLTPGEDARDSAAPPITITTALPLPFWERRWARLDLLTGQWPDQMK